MGVTPSLLCLPCARHTGEQIPLSIETSCVRNAKIAEMRFRPRADRLAPTALRLPLLRTALGRYAGTGAGVSGCRR